MNHLNLPFKWNITNFVAVESKKNSREFFNLITYLRILKLFGVNICEARCIKTKRTEIIRARNIIKFLWIILLVKFTSETYSGKFRKAMVVRFGIQLSTFLIWYHLINCEVKLAKVIEKLHRITNLHGISQIWKIIILCYFFIILDFSIGIYKQVYLFNVIDQDEEFREITFSLIDSYYISPVLKRFALYLLFFTINFLCFLPLYFEGFYVIVCLCMKLILSKHVQINKLLLKTRSVISSDVDVCFQRYESILSHFRLINSLLSYPIFLASSNNCFSILWMLLTILKLGDSVLFESFTTLIINFIALINTSKSNQ